MSADLKTTIESIAVFETWTRNSNSAFTLLMCYIAICSKQYDPYGQVSDNSTGLNEYDIFSGFNSEEYNPVTETQFLRARYYTPETGTFLSQDTVLGNISNLNSQNRYSYAEDDPVNNADPSGHSIADSSYARNMAANGMIDEILIMEVAGTLIQNENKAKAAFSSQLYKAQAVSYQDIQAINSISGISQATANYYINNGGLAALKAAISLGCVPGEIVNGTIKMFETSVNAAKSSVNAQIDSVKVNKTAQNEVWVAEQARLDAEETGDGIIPNMGIDEPGLDKLVGFDKYTKLTTIVNEQPPINLGLIKITSRQTFTGYIYDGKKSDAAVVLSGYSGAELITGSEASLLGGSIDIGGLFGLGFEISWGWLAIGAALTLTLGGTSVFARLNLSLNPLTDSSFTIGISTKGPDNSSVAHEVSVSGNAILVAATAILLTQNAPIFAASAVSTLSMLARAV